MITVQILGGLGNQMFQYAFAKSIELVTHERVCLNLSGFDSYKSHSGYMLNIFPLSIAQCPDDLLPKRLDGIIGKIRKKINLLPNDYYHEKNLSCFDLDEVINKKHYFGYFQSELFFSRFSETILKEFHFPALSTETSLVTRDNIIRSKNSISIHVRRGDYLASNNSKIFRTCPSSYYKQAIDYIKESIGDDISLFVFSDDTLWAKENINFPYMTYFVQGNTGKNSWEDMALMSLCSHNVIANSTFSWWGAWLNCNQDKVVCAPGNWFHLDQLNNNNILPERWIKFKI